MKFDALRHRIDAAEQFMVRTDPPVSEAQRRAMWAAKEGRSTLGIPKDVGAEFAEADPGGKLPERKDETSDPDVEDTRKKGKAVESEIAQKAGLSSREDSFAEVEQKAAKEYGSEEAGKRVAAAVGFAKYGKQGMEQKAQAGKK